MARNHASNTGCGNRIGTCRRRLCALAMSRAVEWLTFVLLIGTNLRVELVMKDYKVWERSHHQPHGITGDNGMSTKLHAMVELQFWENYSDFIFRRCLSTSVYFIDLTESTVCVRNLSPFQAPCENGVFKKLSLFSFKKFLSVSC